MPRANTRTNRPRGAKQRRRTLRKRPPRPRSSRDEISDALLAAVDELDLIGHMLDCAPVITMAVQTMDDRSPPEGSIARWLKILQRSGAPKRSAGHDDPEHLRLELLGAPDALNEAARWRLQRVALLLHSLCHACVGVGKRRAGRRS